MLNTDNPSAFYPDSSGHPLQNGVVYFGLPGLNPATNPLTVYWDSAGTQPAAQPVAIANGRTVRQDGTPSRIWVMGDYSKLVQDAKGRQVVYETNQPQPPTVQQSVTDRFSGTGAPATFTLSATPADATCLDVYVAGVYQQKNSYTLVGNQLTITAAAAANNVEAVTRNTLNYANVAQSIAASLGIAAASAAAATGSAAAAAHIYAGTYATDPTTRPDGTGVRAGDEYFNSTSNLQKRFNGAIWVASDINTANLAASSGSTLIGDNGTTVADRLNAANLADYTALRAYVGAAKTALVTGYLVSAVPSGIAGLFTRDDSDTTSADNGGTIIVAANGKRWKRNTTGVAASPFWFELPLTSSGVDYTVKIQAVLDCRRFEFPPGFQASCKTLYLRSNSVGVFNDAKFTLLDAQPAGTQVVVLGDASGYKCTNSVFYGGQVDGNRANNTAAGSTTTIAGGDGGMHGIQVHNARGVRWYGPKTSNCGTDGILVWQRYAGDTFGATEVADVHFYSPITDGNGRQGISVVACDDMHFYDASVTNTGLGTGAKLPQAGIDIEGNTATDNVGVYFHGKTYCAGNFGRALMTHNQGGVYRITLDDLVCSANNVNGDGQVVMNVAAGSGKNYMKARKVIITGSGTGFGLCDTSFTPTTETPVNSFEIDSVESDAKVIFRDQAVLAIGRIVATGASTTTDNASAMFYNPQGRVGRVEAYNTSGASNGFCLLVAGANRFTIDSAYTSGPRGIYLFDGVSNKTVNDLTIDGTLVGSAVRIRNATKNTVSAKLIGTITGERPVVFEGTSDDNQVAFEWEAANTESVLVIGNRNRIKLRSIRAAGDAAITVGATGVDTMIHTSYFKGATGTGHVNNTGTGTLVIGSFPKTVNT